MKKIKSLKELQVDESYLVWVGYDYSPSGFDIGTFNLGGNFELPRQAAQNFCKSGYAPSFTMSRSSAGIKRGVGTYL